MAYVTLILAGIFEIGWPLGLKLGWDDRGFDVRWIVFAAVSMAISGVLLIIAQRTIPIGTAYAVWTGIGATGTFFLGVYYFGDPATVARFAGAGLIVAGIVTLKIA